MEIEWIAEENQRTIAHASIAKINGKKIISPQHALTTSDAQLVGSNKLFDSNVCICPELLTAPTFQEIGKDLTVANALTNRMIERKQKGRVNLVYARIPSGFNVNGARTPVNTIDHFQASGLLNVQIEADADCLIPPLPAQLTQSNVFDTVIERTITENQTASKEREIIGYIPTTTDAPLVREMVKQYVKMGVRFFAVDFSSSPLNRQLFRVTISTIREMLKIKREKKTKVDSQYYLHVFNVAFCKKSPAPITPITDLLSHAYGADSTSGVIWGGGNLVTEKLRWYNTKDYGAYQVGSLKSEGINLPASETEGNPLTVYKKLRADRLKSYANESNTIIEKVSEGDAIHGYASYLAQKERPKAIVNSIFSDIKEIQAFS